MENLTLPLIVAIFAGSIYLRIRLTRPRQSDYDSIQRMLDSRGLRMREIQPGRNYWYYWARGNLLLSNIARVFVVLAEAPDGMYHEIHVAFDPLRRSGDPIILMER